MYYSGTVFNMLKSLLILLVISLPAHAGIPVCALKPYKLPELKGYHHMKYAPNHKGRLYDGGAFVASIDTFDDDNNDGVPEYLAQPEWVAMHIKAYSSARPSGYAPGAKRPNPWYSINDFKKEQKHFKTKKTINDSYRGAGRTGNRWHLAMRADANRISQEPGCNTFVFANAVPQAVKFNQGIWLGLENYISSLSNEYSELWVVSGPIYTPNKKIKYIGESNKKEIPVGVPDKLFKVFFIELKDGSSVQVHSLIYPNKFNELPENYKTGKCSKDKYYNHNPYLVSLAQVEKETGLEFFPNIDMDLSEYKNMKANNLPFFSEINRVGYCQ